MKIDGGLRSLFREHLPQFDWCSLESPGTGNGIPDSNFCRQGVEGFIEYKLTSGWTVPLRPDQVGWICRRVRYGGRVWVATRQMAPAGPRTSPRDALWLIPGALAKEAKLGGLRALAQHPTVHVWQGGPSAWPWPAIARELVA